MNYINSNGTICIHGTNDICNEEVNNNLEHFGTNNNASDHTTFTVTPSSQESFHDIRFRNDESGEDFDDGINITKGVPRHCSQTITPQHEMARNVNLSCQKEDNYHQVHVNYPHTYSQPPAMFPAHGQSETNSIESVTSSNHERSNPQHQTWKINFLLPYPIDLKDHVPTWEHLWPNLHVANPAPLINTTSQIKAYKLSLLSHTDFTVTAVMHHTNRYDFVPSLSGLRKPIKEITRIHAREGEKAILEGGRWRVPLSVYQVFYSYLCNQSYTEVEGIPQAQLSIASIGRAAAERGDPSPEALIDNGVPPGLAYSLAPYQRGGVDFVLQRNGKALIADEMGLGKTVQSISAMACYESEWPLLVLTPSTARYHWEAEFLNWLGKARDDTPTISASTEEYITRGVQGNDECWNTESKRSSDSMKRKQLNCRSDKLKRKRTPTMKFLDPCEINVVSSSNDCILKSNTRVVVLSYGLVGNLIKKKALRPSLFRCIIVDESHMLKNKKSKRTECVMPLLKSAIRVIMLSGTPALSKPKELFPQLNALGEGNGWWDDEEDFNSKYVNDKYSDPSYAELHTLLTSTVMIRRLKKDILKDMAGNACFIHWKSALQVK
jgi:hypothetical protein